MHRAVIKNYISPKERLKEIADFIFSVELLDPKLKGIVEKEFHNDIKDNVTFVNNRVTHLLKKYKINMVDIVNLKILKVLREIPGREKL